MRTRILIAVMALLVLTAVVLAGENCSYCGSSLIWTGETKTEWGQMFYLYKCPAGHMWWVKAPSFTPQKGNDFSLGPKCPTCGTSVIWTGKTYTEWGQVWKIYKCPAGHISVGK